MSLFISSLNSGSNGNCYYIGKTNEAILVDAGLSCLETEKRLGRLGLCMQQISAIFISHEHSDHIFGLPSILKRHRIPVYITPKTLLESKLAIDPGQVRFFEAFQPVTIGGMTVTAFPKKHDACDPHSFIIRSETVTVGVFTDIGTPCEHLEFHFRQCHAAFLESNFDDQLLEQGGYPWFLKNRIRGGLGHLSNARALQLFMNHKPAFMSHLILAHLSKANNSPEKVEALFAAHAQRIKITIASRVVETPVFLVDALLSRPAHSKKFLRVEHPAQLTLF